MGWWASGSAVIRILIYITLRPRGRKEAILSFPNERLCYDFLSGVSVWLLVLLVAAVLEPQCCGVVGSQGAWLGGGMPGCLVVWWCQGAWLGGGMPGCLVVWWCQGAWLGGGVPGCLGAWLGGGVPRWWDARVPGGGLRGRGYETVFS